MKTIGDFVESAAARFEEAGLSFGHGTATAFDDAAFLVLETLNLQPDSLEKNWTKKLSAAQIDAVSANIEKRISTRKPSSYIVNRSYIQGIPFYVDERVIVPRSFIGEILAPGLPGGDGFVLIDDPGGVKTVLDLCTGSGCLAIFAAHVFPNARIDAVDLSPDALAVAQKNVTDHALSGRITLHQGDLFAPLSEKKYDLIITNPPYVEAPEMAVLPDEYRHEPALALAGGDDGLDIARRILDEARDYLTPGGALMCEIGTGRERLEKHSPDMPFLWLDTEDSHGEVFWLTRKQMDRGKKTDGEKKP